jgi:CheY-like chemotaxis protein
MRESGMPLAEELQAGSGKLRVLVVDDEATIRDALSEYLTIRTPSYEVMTAADGFEAGRLVATFRPDVVLLDLRMPGMDGFQVCRTIKADPETSSTVVIAMTGYHTPETEAKTLECGAVKCFAKPVEPATLSGFIDGLFDKRASARSRRGKRAKS